MAEPNGILTRAQIMTGLIRDVGFPVLMVGIFVGWAAGWLPLRPLDAMTKTTGDLVKILGDHDARMVQAQERRLEVDKNMAESVQRFTLLAERMERRDRLSYCVNTFKDAQMRKDCLQ